MAANIAMIKNIDQMGIVYMFKESDFSAQYQWERTAEMDPTLSS